MIAVIILLIILNTNGFCGALNQKPDCGFLRRYYSANIPPPPPHLNFNPDLETLNC